MSVITGAGFYINSLFCRRGVQEQCVSLFFQTTKSHVSHFCCLLLSTCKVKYFNKIIKYIQYILIIEELKLSSTVVLCTSKC